MGKKEKKKNTTQYGETVPTEFGWITPEKQKENSERLNNATKKKK